MELEGIHHITCITGDAPQNVRFYAGTLGLRMVKKSVNQDDPTVYHLFYASDEGAAGSDITFFEYPGVARGRHGAGMIYRVRWRVASEASLDFWERRLESQGVSTKRDDGTLFFEDPEGLELEFAVVDTTDEPLRASHPEIPDEHALLGFDGVRTYTDDPSRSAAFLSDTMGFAKTSDEEWISRGASRGSFYAYDPAPAQRGVAGAGTVHHVAWSSTMEDHGEWRERVVAGGADVTPIIDRFWFRSIYFRLWGLGSRSMSRSRLSGKSSFFLRTTNTYAPRWNPC